MKRIGDFIKWFCYIAVSIVFVLAIITGLYENQVIPQVWLWDILLSAFLTTLITIVIAFQNTKTLAGTILKFIFHYLALCLVMIVCGSWFGWLSLHLTGILMMMGSVAVVYVLSFGFYYIIDLKQARDINQKLKEKYQEKQL